MQLRNEPLRGSGQRATQRRKLEQQRPDFVTQSLAGRPDKLFDRVSGVQEQGVGLAANAPFSVQPWTGQHTGCLDDETEMLRRLSRVYGVLARRQRRVERSVNPDGAEQRVPRVGSEAVARQIARCFCVLPDDASPPGKMPG